MRSLRWAFFLMSGLLCSQALSSAETSIAEARLMFVKKQSQAVSLRGQLMFSNVRLGLAFLQDETGGIAMLPKARGRNLARIGTWVRVTGVVIERYGMPVLVKNSATMEPADMELTCQDARRIKAVTINLDAAVKTGLDGVFTHVSGVVRRAYASGDGLAHTTAEISTPHGSHMVRLPWGASSDEMQSWLDTPVSASGMLVTRADGSLLPAGTSSLLFALGKMSWNIQAEELEKWFTATPVHSLGELKSEPRGEPTDRVLLSGIVTAVKSGHWVSLRLRDGGVQVFTRQLVSFQPGDHLFITCVHEHQEGRHLFLDGICKFLSRKPPPEPQVADVSENRRAYLHAELSKIQGVLRDDPLPGGSRLLNVIPEQGPSCLIDWQPFLSESQMADIKNGSLVEITGLVNLLPDATSTPAAGFKITPRSLADVRLIEGPAWWTTARLRQAVSILGGSAALGILGVALLWRRTKSQDIRLRMITTEERRRIAGEFHDTVHQLLSGAALHLETLKGAVKATPEITNRLIDDAATMLRHCQLEARHCIWDLHSEKSHEESLAEALKDWLRMRAAQTQHTNIRFQNEGAPAPPDAGISHHVMRITQEAVNNALNHACAENITVKLSITHEAINLEVVDDGTGYEVSVATRPGHGNFGLITQQQRARKIGATLRIESHPGQGTRVTLLAPVRQTARRHVATSI
jgi:signal transduction histidine kinase